MSNSCIGCKFLFIVDDGYSNYTVTDSTIYCGKRKNKNLPSENPWDWIMDVNNDNFPKTSNSRCDSYSEGSLIRLDVDGDDKIGHYTTDLSVISGII